MIRAVIFDMFETLITHYSSELYFGAQMARDAGISEEKFQILWRPTEYERTIGMLTLEEIITNILEVNHCYTKERLNVIVAKRIAAKEACFHNLHPEIIPMLEGLKQRNRMVGLISNCFSEEAKVIRASVLFPYFDALYLSYEQGIQKPDVEIFRRCMEELSVKPEECLYVGDGGSEELETARAIGLRAVQAAWYLKDGTSQPAARKEDFSPLESPLEVLRAIH
ncbi:MAG: putative hydrolase of the superfamily [Clostridiales bacterium]|nr:putative hydrolase of the superfamily [Clostridiales bacterium]